MVFYKLIFAAMLLKDVDIITMQDMLTEQQCLDQVEMLDKQKGVPHPTKGYDYYAYYLKQGDYICIPQKIKKSS